MSIFILCYVTRFIYLCSYVACIVNPRPDGPRDFPRPDGGGGV